MFELLASKKSAFWSNLKFGPWKLLLFGTLGKKRKPSEWCHQFAKVRQILQSVFCSCFSPPTLHTLLPSLSPLFFSFSHFHLSLVISSNNFFEKPLSLLFLSKWPSIPPCFHLFYSLFPPSLFSFPSGEKGKKEEGTLSFLALAQLSAELFLLSKYYASSKLAV